VLCRLPELASSPWFVSLLHADAVRLCDTDAVPELKDPVMCPPYHHPVSTSVALLQAMNKSSKLLNFINARMRVTIQDS